jgi:Ca-activated chloride channel family protein
MNYVFNESLHGGNHGLSTSVLEAVRIEGHLRGLSCELNISQTFRNPGKKNIEAVYTFPLPHKAVLLELTAKIGERTLKGSVLPKAKAEERYEDAVSEGNGAIMLERADDGICTVNFGNLMPGESACLEYRYAYLLDWQQDSVRFQLPMTIAPRYGDPIAAGYQPHQIPGTDFLAEYPFSIKLQIEGVLRDAMFDSPSHGVKVLSKEHHVEITLRDSKAWMDRDFVLNMKKTGVDKADGQISIDPVSGAKVALASFYPQFAGNGFESICAKIVVDCSGSMDGDSIDQARAGLHRILDGLRETDTFNIIRFGSTHRAYFPTPVPAKGRNLRNARGQVDNLMADLGGTEMESALDFTYGSGDESGRPSAILLITDGGISNHRDVIRKAVRSGHRIFTVGVGSAVAEEFVREIASKTGGACELVSPNEGMAEAIYRQFQRMKQPRATNVGVAWPGDVAWQTPSKIGPVFAGDTLHVFAGLRDCEGGTVKIRLEIEDGRHIEQEVSVSNSSKPWESLSRVAISSRILDIDKDRPALAEELSNTYQLVTRHTNYLILDMRADEHMAHDLPELVKVNQMLAAGWGGSGSILKRQNSASISGIPAANPSFDIKFSRKMRFDSASPDNWMARRADISELQASHMDETMDLDQNDLREKMRGLISEEISVNSDWLNSFSTQILCSLPETLRTTLNDLIHNEGWEKSTTTASLLMALLRNLSMDADQKEFILKLEVICDMQLVRYFEEGLELEADYFEWNHPYECLPAPTHFA